MRVLMLGVSDLKSYSRGRVLFNGLKRNGIDVDVLFWTGTMRYFMIFLRLLTVNFDVVIVTGKFVLFISWLLKLWHRKPIIFDTFISDYDTLVLDRKVVPKNSFLGSIVWWSDKIAPSIATISFLDTYQHVLFFEKEFGIDRSRLRIVHVGTDEEIFYPGKNLRERTVLVHFHGTFIPLQGVDVIIKSAKILEKYRNIRFCIVGTGQTYNECIKMLRGLNIKSVDLIPFFPLKDLANKIRSSSFCLGIFGSTGKALRVVPNKAYESIASSRALITMDSPAIREVFTNKEDVFLVPPNNPEKLARAILKLSEDVIFRNKIASNGYKLFKKKYSSISIGKELLKVINEVVNTA